MNVVDPVGRHLPRFTVVFALLLGTGVDAPSRATEADSSAPTNSTKTLSLEELIQRPVTTVSRQAEPFFTAPAAVSVITGDEIRRSGVRTLPDALRLAPGMEVGRLNGTQWAVSTRGFSDRFANKLLVMIDGRSVYQPVFGGVYWDLQDTLLEDIDRIEVVRGPGGTLWGANAMDGVVNIITKNANETVGGYVNGTYGTQDYGLAARYGMRLGEYGFVRGYFKHDNFDEMKLGNQDARDDWSRYSTGLRTDWEVANNHVTLQGDYFYGHETQQQYFPTYAPPYSALATEEDYLINGGNLLGRWTHAFSEEHDLQLQTYWDNSSRRVPSFNYQLDVFDADFQHRFPLPWFRETIPQQITYGFDYRLNSDNSKNVLPVYQLFPARRQFQTFSAFAQDQFTLVPERLTLRVGSKLEHNDFTGFEVQPDARLAWYPTTNQTIWAAVSRAIRTPSRASHNLLANNPVDGIGIVRFTGNPESESERLLGTELGYRIKPIKPLFFDISGYYFMFDNIEFVRPGTPFVETTPGPPHLVIPATESNLGQADTYGLELAAEYEATAWWRLRAGYNWFNYRNQSNVTFDNRSTPRNQAFLRSSMTFETGKKGALEFDLWWRFRDRLESYNIDRFHDLDARLAWKARSRWEVAVVGQNLFRKQRQDFGWVTGTISEPLSEIPRSVYGSVTYRF